MEQDWVLVWSDEFDVDGSPDPTKWTFDVEGNSIGWGNNELQNHTAQEARNAWVSDGLLFIEARKEINSYPGTDSVRSYTSARLVTKGKADWLYGRFEVRARLPRGKGTWPAVWMLNAETDDWPASGELDIMEAIGSEPNRVFTTVWCAANEDSNGSSRTIDLDDVFLTFHRYWMEWDQDGIRFFVDDILVHTWFPEGRSLSHWPFYQRFYLIMNLSIGGKWEGNVDDDIFNAPVRMEIDYVRVYRKR